MLLNDILEFLKVSNINFHFQGSESEEIIGFSSICHYKNNTISWLRNISTLERGNIKLQNYFACLITKNGTRRIQHAKCQIWVQNPKDTFFDIVNYFWGEEIAPSISPSAVIEEGAQIGEHVSIGPFSYISSEATIGNYCSIGIHVVIKGRVTIGDYCVIQSGAVIGEDGFGFIKLENKQKFMKHYGGVTLADHVHIGSQTCVCRGSIDDTYINEYTKIDNLCYIAHNVEIGKRCLLVAGTIVMGSVHIGDDCWISTSVIRDLRSVGNNCIVGMGSIVVKDVSSGTTVIGNPAGQLGL